MKSQEAIKQQGDVIWHTANLLRGLYRPPQYRRVMTPPPYRPNAWFDHQKTKIGFEIPFNRHFYKYRPLRPLAAIEQVIADLERDNGALLKEVTA